ILPSRPIQSVGSRTEKSPSRSASSADRSACCWLEIPSGTRAGGRIAVAGVRVCVLTRPFPVCAMLEILERAKNFRLPRGKTVSGVYSMIRQKSTPSIGYLPDELLTSWGHDETSGPGERHGRWNNDGASRALELDDPDFIAMGVVDIRERDLERYPKAPV